MTELIQAARFEAAKALKYHAINYATLVTVNNSTLASLYAGVTTLESLIKNWIFWPRLERKTIPLLISALSCWTASGINLSTDAEAKDGETPADRLKAFMVSPPVIRQMLVKRSYPARHGDVPDQYYLVRFQSDAYLLALADKLEALLHPAQTITNARIAAGPASVFMASGRYGNVWWTVGGLARDVKVWNQVEDVVDNPVRRVCENQFIETMELILLGINDITLTPAIIGKWAWIDDSFKLEAERHWQGRLIKTTFIGEAERDEQNRIASIYLHKTTIDDLGFERPRSWSYRFEYQYEPGARPYFLPARVKKFIRETNGAYREIDQLEYQEVTITAHPLAHELFMPDFFTTTSSFHLSFEGGHFYYYDDQGRKLRQPKANEVIPVWGSRQVLIFYSVLVILLIFSVLFYVYFKLRQ